MDYISTSDANARFYQRSVTCELELEAGEYVVYVRIICAQKSDICFSNRNFCSREWIVTSITLK